MQWNQNHKERENINEEIRDHERLKKRYADLPYHERNYGFYIIALIAGWFANILSGITEFSRIFVFIFGLAGSLAYGNSIAWIVTLVLIVLLEIFHRIIAKNYFKSFVERGGHERKQNGNFILMLILGCFLTFLSFSGGFDLVRLVKEKPEKEAVQEIPIDQVQAALSPLLSQAKKDVSEYRKTREWKGRLSDKDAKTWSRLKTKVREREDSLTAAITRLPYLNLELKEKAEGQYQASLQDYQTEINQQGYGLGFVTIIAILVLYLSLWFEEKYVLQRKEYLDRKYDKQNVSDIQPSPTLSNASADALEAKLKKLETLLNRVTTLNHNVSANGFSENGVATDTGAQKKN